MSTPLLLALPLLLDPVPKADPGPTPWSLAAEALNEALQEARAYEGAHPASFRYSILERGSRAALAELPVGSASRGRLEGLLARTAILREQSSARALRVLESGSRELEADLSFEPLVEAELPAGFPSPTQLGEVEIKVYPSYRMAKAAMEGGRRAGENRAFWSLFQHIQEHDIAMTAPVQMDYEAGQDGPVESSMAFLYATPNLNDLGVEGAVSVVDAVPLKVISTGRRGYRTPDVLDEAREQLLAWLDDNQDAYRATGEMRVMGWNSPMVPASRRYFEVQIPIEPVSQPTAALR